MKRTTAVIIINAYKKYFQISFYLPINKKVYVNKGKKLTGHDGLGFCAQTDK